MFVRLAAVALAVSLLFWSKAARAERELIVPFHESGHIVFDQLSGLRLSSESGAAYAGFGGIAFRTTKLDALAPGGASRETKSTDLWLSPAADVFVTEHLSLGGRLELAHTWGSVEGGGQRLELPGTTSLTILPRIGFYAAFTDRIGLWPRAGVGFSSVESVSFVSTGSAPVRETFRSMLLDVDLSVVYRFGETFFMRAGPEVGVTLGGQRTVEDNGVESGAAAATVQVSGITAFGMNLEL